MNMQRQEMINELARFTGIPLDTLERMTDEQLDKLYVERVLLKGML